jgi:hydroxymethylpyrimidine/phosphomethylpyrimidine kinase
VLDPVMIAKSGDPLLRPDARQALIDRVLPLATVVTPNLPEAELLTGERISNEADMLAAAQKISSLGPRWVLVKGGHLPGPPTDVLVSGDGVVRYPAGRISTVHTHGTGCTLASAIASYLAMGRDIPGAVAGAKDYVSGAIDGGFPLGSGIGPVDHGWRWRGGPAG